MEATVIEIKEKAKKEKMVRPKISPVMPIDIVDVWRLVERSVRDVAVPYPDTTEDQPEVIRSHVFNYLNQNNFAGLIARVGRRPVATVLGNIQMRPYGRPHRFAFIWCVWVDPAFRNQGIGKTIWAEYTNKLKKAEIYNWESHANDQVTKELCKEGASIKKLMNVIGGRL